MTSLKGMAFDGDADVSASFTLRVFLLNVLAFFTSALVLISALAWNDAAREYLKRYPALKKRGMWAYALIVTASPS